MKLRRFRPVHRYPGLALYAALFFAYLYLPIAVLIGFSFNSGRVVSVWEGFSWRWYASALENDNLLSAVETSLFVAFIAMTLATAIALAAAMTLVRARRLKYRRAVELLINLPLVLPEIVLAVAVLIVFSQIGISDGVVRLVIAHTTFCIPFAFLPIRARLQGMQTDLEEAAQDLYATKWTTFRRVTLPQLMPGVFSGAVLAFVISMDDFITSNMLNSGGSTTLPVYIFSLVKQGVTPELNAISTIIVGVSLAIALVALRLQRGSKKSALASLNE